MSTERPVDKGLIEQAVKALHGSTTWLIPEQAYGGAAYSNPATYQHKTPDAERAFERKEALIPELQRLATSPHLSPTAKQAVEQALQTLMAAKTPADVARAVMMAELAATHGENAKSHGTESHQARMARLWDNIEKHNEDADACFKDMRKYGIHFREKDEEDREKIKQQLAHATSDKEKLALEDKLIAVEERMAAYAEPQLAAHPEARPAYDKFVNEIQQERKSAVKTIQNEFNQNVLISEEKKVQPTTGENSFVQGEDVSQNDVAAQSFVKQPSASKSTGHERR